MTMFCLTVRSSTTSITCHAEDPHGRDHDHGRVPGHGDDLPTIHREQGGDIFRTHPHGKEIQI